MRYLKRGWGGGQRRREDEWNDDGNYKYMGNVNCVKCVLDGSQR